MKTGPVERFLQNHPRLRLRSLSVAAALWRRLMFRTTFVAVTGSVGKTTAVECLKQVLASCFTVNGTEYGNNSGRGVAAAVLRTRFRHQFIAIEVGTRQTNDLRKAAWMIAPHTAVVLAVAAVHTDSFAGLDAIAREKSQLLSRLGRRGVAVLNGDDPRVAAMAGRCRGRVILFGRSPHCDVRATEVSSVWPARLSFRVHSGAQSCRVNTRLVGEHWLASVLAALAVALWHGVPLHQAAAAVERVEPQPSRMEPVLLPSGAYALRDEFNRSFAGFPAALRVLEHAPGRRILVFHDVYDSGLAFRERFQAVGKLVSTAADLTLLYGNESRRARNAMIEGGVLPRNISAFADIWAVAEFLKANLGPGDLVLLRSGYSDAAGRIYFAQLGSVGCRIPQCGKALPCDLCVELKPGLENVSGLPAPARPYWLPIRR